MENPVNDPLVHFSHRQRTTGIPDAPLDKLAWHIREAELHAGVPPRGLHVAHDLFDAALSQLAGHTKAQRQTRGVQFEFPGGVPVRNGRRIWRMGATWIEPRDLPDGLVVPVLGRDRVAAVNGLQELVRPTMLEPERLSGGEPK